jgi:hypothetical protein
VPDDHGDYVIRWRPVTGAWRAAHGWDRESAETAMTVDRLCTTGPLTTEAIHPNGHRVWRDYKLADA